MAQLVGKLLIGQIIMKTKSFICPYCEILLTKENIVDSSFYNPHKPKRKNNTRNIYLCYNCKEFSESKQKQISWTKDSYQYFQRKNQYTLKNLRQIENETTFIHKTDLYEFEPEDYQYQKAFKLKEK